MSAMKSFRGMEVQLHPFLTSVLDRNRFNPSPIRQEAEFAPEPVRAFRRNLLLLPGIEPRIVYPKVSKNWVPRRGVRGSERRKCVMAEDIIGGPKCVRTSANVRTGLIVTILSVILKKKKIQYHFHFLIYYSAFSIF